MQSRVATRSSADQQRPRSGDTNINGCTRGVRLRAASTSRRAQAIRVRSACSCSFDQEPLQLSVAQAVTGISHGTDSVSSNYGPAFWTAAAINGAILTSPSKLSSPRRYILYHVDRWRRIDS